MENPDMTRPPGGDEPDEVNIGPGVIVETYYPVDGQMANWWTLHVGRDLVGITHRGSGDRIVMPRPAFEVLVAKLRAAGELSDHES
jgi:hypothetical protein